MGTFQMRMIVHSELASCTPLGEGAFAHAGSKLFVPGVLTALTSSAGLGARGAVGSITVHGHTQSQCMQSVHGSGLKACLCSSFGASLTVFLFRAGSP